MPYLVMQFVPGHSLQARVDEQGPLEIKEVLRLARQAASGLAAAHAQGVVHRDVKPANILLEDSVDRVLLSDFGLARTVDDATLTRSGVLAGTPHYMSPEQASGQSVDQRSDLFSLGSAIYFMCTGRPPYRSDSPMAVLNRICHEPHRPLDEVNPDVPIELAELVDRLLAKNPADRFATAQEVETRFASLLAQLQQGNRLRHRGLVRRLRVRYFQQGRPLLKRLTIGLTAAVVCMLIGASVVYFVAPRTTTQVGNTLDAPAPEAAPSPTASRLPPDTFSRDLSDVNKLLESIDAQDASGSIAIGAAQNSQWQSDVAGLRSELSQIEDFFGNRPPTSASETSPPKTERNAR
jgi:serine/threonine protein kinase